MKRKTGKQTRTLSEGLWFAVPVNEGGFAAGIIAAASRDGSRLFGYFFGPRLATQPMLCQVVDYRPEDSVLSCRFSELGLREGRWPILGMDPDYSRENWPMPPFRNVDVVSGRVRAAVYDRDKPDELVSFRVCRREEAMYWPEDGLSGHLYVEELLNDLLPWSI